MERACGGGWGANVSQSCLAASDRKDIFGVGGGELTPRPEQKGLAALRRRVGRSDAFREERVEDY